MDRFMSKLIVSIISGALLLGVANPAFAQKSGEEKKTKETVPIGDVKSEKEKLKASIASTIKGSKQNEPTD